MPLLALPTPALLKILNFRVLSTPKKAPRLQQVLVFKRPNLVLRLFHAKSLNFSKFLHFFSLFKPFLIACFPLSGMQRSRI